MRRDQLKELHYITPIQNVASILQHGILCNELVKHQRHQSVAMPEIQERRATKIVPGGQHLHKYVNLYIHARNPMLYKRKEQHETLCVLCINPKVLDLPDVVITSQNAASDYVRFYPSPDGLIHLDYGTVFAEYWTHPDDPILEFQHRSIKCAELLVPGKVESRLVIGAYVSNTKTKTALTNELHEHDLKLEITVDSHLFFQ